MNKGWIPDRAPLVRNDKERKMSRMTEEIINRHAGRKNKLSCRAPTRHPDLAEGVANTRQQNP